MITTNTKFMIKLKLSQVTAEHLFGTRGNEQANYEIEVDEKSG